MIISDRLVRIEHGERQQLDLLTPRFGSGWGISVFDGQDGARMFLSDDELKEFLEASLQKLKDHEQQISTHQLPPEA